ncbi:MAG: heparan-alpha-glucosaminide N-acetyltransferase domain-containing protein, partial [Acidobacteriota bacterium]
MTAARRLVSLDVLRGMTVAAMIVVNNPGNWLSVFPSLEHASWNGCTPADLVFPFFIVIMGMALPFSLERRSLAGQASEMHRRVLTRAAILLALGLLLNAVAAWPDLSAIRIPGVLQRIALTYAIAALLVMHLRPRSQFAAGVVLLFAHWALLTLVAFGGQPAGNWTPSHNLAGWLDLAVFGPHLLTTTGDPEGLLGVLPSIATALGGALAGRWIQAAWGRRSPLPGLIAGGAAAVVAGLIWSVALPMNKPLWTGSYAIFSTGLATLALVACYLA